MLVQYGSHVSLAGDRAELSWDSAKFNGSLVRALEQHRKYWTSDEDLVDDPDGFIALAPLATSVLARSVGISIDVESDYLPSNFIKGMP